MVSFNGKIPETRITTDNWAPKSTGKAQSSQVGNFNFLAEVRKLKNPEAFWKHKPMTPTLYSKEIEKLSHNYADVAFINPKGCTPLSEEIAQQPINNVDKASNKYIEQDEQAFA